MVSFILSRPVAVNLAYPGTYELEPQRRYKTTKLIPRYNEREELCRLIPEIFQDEDMRLSLERFLNQ